MFFCFFITFVADTTVDCICDKCEDDSRSRSPIGFQNGKFFLPIK